MTRFEKIFLHASTAALGLSGLLHAAMKYLLEPADPYSVVNHPLQPWMLAAHVVVAPFALFAVGIIVKDHIWAESRRPVVRHRHSGRATFATLALCAVSGVLLQVTTREGLRLALAWTHLGTGGLYLAGYLAHLVLGWRRRQARHLRRRLLVSVPAARYNSVDPGSEGEPTPSVEGLA